MKNIFTQTLIKKISIRHHFKLRRLLTDGRAATCVLRDSKMTLWGVIKFLRSDDLKYSSWEDWPALL